MAKLYLQIENGLPVNHPAFENNLIQVFGCVPRGWEIFNRIEFPELETFQVLEIPEVAYVKTDDGWTDAWFVREMTIEEKQIKQRLIDEEMATIGTEILPTIPVTTI